MSTTPYVDVLLTDEDGAFLVRCPNEQTAGAVAAAAVWSGGGVDAWRVPERPDVVGAAGIGKLMHLLRAGASLDDVINAEPL